MSDLAHLVLSADLSWYLGLPWGEYTPCHMGPDKTGWLPAVRFAGLDEWLTTTAEHRCRGCAVEVHRLVRRQWLNRSQPTLELSTRPAGPTGRWAVT